MHLASPQSGINNQILIIIEGTVIMSNIDSMIQSAQQGAQQAVNNNTQQGVTIDQQQDFQQVQNTNQQAQYQVNTNQQPVNQQAQVNTNQQPVNQQQNTQQVNTQQHQQQNTQQVNQQANNQNYQQQPVQAQYIPNQQQQAQYNNQQVNTQQQNNQQQNNQQQNNQQYLPAQQNQQQQYQQQNQQYQMQPMQAQLPAHLMALASQPMEMTMDRFMEMGLAVDAWLKPDFQGMTIGENAVAVMHVDVEIDMTEKKGFTLIQALRYGENPVRYDYTTDNMVSKDGTPWLQVLGAAYAVDPTVQPYRAAQIPMTVIEDAVNLKNEVVAKVGTRLGYTTSVTGWAPFEALYRECARQNILGQKVIVRLTNEGKVKGTNKWGIVKFELLGVSQATGQTQQQQTA